MLALEFFTWWYGQGWKLLVKNMQKRLGLTAQTFSVGILLQTLFAPFRRIVTYPGSSLDAKFRAAMDNLVSRCIGFSVRILVLLVAAIVLIFGAVFAAIVIVAWPLLPLLAVASLVKGIL